MSAPSVMRCQVCGFIYRQDEGMPEFGISPGTRWEDIPDDWQCPDCGTGKSDFHMAPYDENALAY